MLVGSFKNVITRISFIAPTVDPLDPPMVINVISTISTNGDQVPITVEGCTLAPVVVMADTTVNNSSIGMIFDAKYKMIVDAAINVIITLNCKS